MNRRTFFATLLAAPAAAVVALREPEVTDDYAGLVACGSTPDTHDAMIEWAKDVFAEAGSTSWSHQTSSPIADIEAAMKKIRAASDGPAVVWRAAIPRGAVEKH